VKARKVKGLDPAAPLADNAERIVAVRLDELLSFMPRALDPSEVVALHDMRIAAKRLRYILEVTADTCFGPYAATALKRTKDVQDLLGEIHDCDEQLPRVLALLEELRAADAREARARAPAGTADLEAAHAASTTHATAWRGLNTLAVHLVARRALLFERFLQLWARLQRNAFATRLRYAIEERPAGALTSRSPDGNGSPGDGALESRARAS
jgi:hypothetical protein